MWTLSTFLYKYNDLLHKTLIPFMVSCRYAEKHVALIRFTVYILHSVSILAAKMFNLHLCNTAAIWYSLSKFGHMHLCGLDYKCFQSHCCNCISFGCTVTIICGNACHGPHNNSLYLGSKHMEFDSLRLVKREAGFPNSRRALIGSTNLTR